MMRRNNLFWNMILVLLSLSFLGSCTSLPDNNKKIPSQTITDGGSTSLGKAFNAQLEQHTGLTGVYLLKSGLDAFVGRAVLARLAERSIDVQDTSLF